MSTNKKAAGICIIGVIGIITSFAMQNWWVTFGSIGVLLIGLSGLGDRA